MSLQEQLLAFEKTAIETALACSNGIVSQAAKALDMSRQSLWLKVKQHGIDVEDFKDVVVKTDLIAVPTQRKVTIGVNPRSVLRRKMLEYAMDVLEANKWNRTQAAQELGVGVRTIRNFINEAKALGIETYRSTYRPGVD